MPQNANPPNAGYSTQANEFKSGHEGSSIVTPGQARPLHNVPIASGVEHAPGREIKEQAPRKKRLVSLPTSSSRTFAIESWTDGAIFNPRASAAETTAAEAPCSPISRMFEEGIWRMGTTIRSLQTASSALHSRGLLMPGRGQPFLVASDLFRMAFFMLYLLFPHLFGIFVTANVLVVAVVDINLFTYLFTHLPTCLH